MKIYNILRCLDPSILTATQWAGITLLLTIAFNQMVKKKFQYFF